jgi:hypothetical protein
MQVVSLYSYLTVFIISKKDEIEDKTTNSYIFIFYGSKS